MRKTACSALFTLQEFNSGELSCQPVKLVFVKVLCGCRGEVGNDLERRGLLMYGEEWRCSLGLVMLVFLGLVAASFVEVRQSRTGTVSFRGARWA